MIYITHETVLVFILRVILGILFFFQGYDKIFKMKVSGVTDFFRDEWRGRSIPDFVLSVSAYFTSYVEFLCGGLLILGLFKYAALYLLGLDLILVCGAFSMLKPMWDMQLLFPRLILLAIILFLPADWDVLSLDYLFGIGRE
jgi:putative oxidoreductase